MTGKPGQLLTPEQSARLAMIHSVERDDLIKHIVEGLRAKAKRESRRMSGLRGKR
jgi:hypothetical protein